MENINPFVIGLLAARAIAIVAILIWVIPSAVKELRRKQQNIWLFILRWLMLFFVIVYIGGATVPTWYSITNISSLSDLDLQNASRLWQGVRELAISGFIIAIYAVARVLSRMFEESENRK